MPNAGIACPWCCKAIETDGLTAGSRIQCPRCRKAFTLRPEDLRAAAVAAAAPTPPARANPPASAAWLVAGTAGGAALLLLAATVGAILLFAGKRTPQVAAAPPAPPPAATPASQPTPAPVEPDGSPDVPRQPLHDDPPPPVKPPVHDAPPPLNPAPPDLKPDSPPPPKAADLPSDLQDKVNTAIDRGVAFLKTAQKADGSWTASQFFLDGFPVGLTSLCGLTLLECGVPADDAHVKNAASFVRRSAPQLEKTYELSLAILFLDRLADPKDEPTLRTLALRLTAGQEALGGWTYDCPALPPDAEAPLLARLEKERTTAAADVDKTPFNRDAIDAADNSNTQFAILGLWTARRHGVPTERVLALVNRRFRASQAGDGNWGYYFAEARNKDKDTLSTPSMTAAGLLGLAVGRAAIADPAPDAAAKPEADAAINKGMRALGGCIGADQKLGNIVLARTLGVSDALNTVKDSGVVEISPDAMGEALDLYFLWSVERVGVLFNQGTIGGKEWYPWGAHLLVDGQNDGGGWGKGGSFISTPTVDTCFALLFLKRANLARDLSTKMEFLIRIDKTVTKP